MTEPRGRGRSGHLLGAALLKLARAVVLPDGWTYETADFWRSGEGRPELAHDKTSFICGAGRCRAGLPGLSAGCQGFRPHDGNRGHELRSLAVYARASIRGSRLDLRFLDGTQLRCCSKRSNTGENRRGGDSGRSRKDMRSANVADIGQRRMDHLSWV